MKNIDLNQPANELYRVLVNQPLTDLRDLQREYNPQSINELENIGIINKVLGEMERLEYLTSKSTQTLSKFNKVLLDKVFEGDTENITPDEQERVLNEFSLVAHEYIWTNPQITLQDLIELNEGNEEVAVKILDCLFPS